MSRSTAVVAAGLASGTYLLATQAFVTPMQPPVSNNVALSASTIGTTQIAEVGALGSNASSVAAAVGLAGMVAAAASTHRRSSRMTRRAEPVSMAAAGVAAAKAAGAAKAAAAAKGAAKVTGAVAGSATTSTMVESAESAAGEFDPEVGGKKYMKWEVGTPEFNKAMAQKRARNTKEWEMKTARNPEGPMADGVFGDAQKADKTDMYDPLSYIGRGFTADAMTSGFDQGTFNPATQIGVTAPLGYFDPLGFCAKGDTETFRKLRTAELKHGRVAMMASLGAVVQHYVKFPGFEKVPAGLSAVNEAPGSYGAIALILVTGALEMGIWNDDGKEVGNFGDPLNWAQIGGYTEDMRNRELNNGRAAMFAAIGIIAAELFTGKDAIEQLGMK